MIRVINKFYNSIFYIALTSLFVILSATLGLEMPIYIATAIICVLIPALFCSDMRSLIAPLMFFYCSVSLKNNNYYGGVVGFSNPSFFIPILIVAALIALILLTKLIFSLVHDKLNLQFPRLTIGFLILGLFYLTGGIFSPYYSINSTLFGLFEFLSFCIFYYLVFFMVDWKTLKKEYVLQCVVALGIVLFIEVFATYFITANLSYLKERDRVIIGWGKSTNVGGMFCMVVGAPFYFVIKNKRIVLNSFLSVLFMAGCFLCQSRGPVLVAFIIYLIGLLIIFLKSDYITKVKFFFATFAFFALFVGCVKIYKDDFLYTFKRFFDSFFNFTNLRDYADNRIEKYEDGLHKFLDYPVLGTGWYSCDAECFTRVILPARWHNTIIQCLATGGVLLTLGYLYHRFETVFILFRKHKRVPINKVFLFLSVLALIGSSMFDCFIFNLGPGAIYGVLLAAIEMAENDDENLFERKKKVLAITK